MEDGGWGTGVGSWWGESGIESYELMSGNRHGGVLSWGMEYAR